MKPRGYQQTAVDECWAALDEKRNTILVAGTGGGKTAMGSFVVKEGLEERGIKSVLWLQHRDKLTEQNANSCRSVVGSNVSISIFDAKTKSIAGQIIFGMIQTVANYAQYLPKIDMVVIDEAHHCPSSTYVKTVKEIRKKNPNVLLFGMTATPVRSDKKTMRVMFDNVAHVIPIPELIINGFLVPPKTFKPIIPGLHDELKNLKILSGGENDMEDVAQALDKKVVNSEVFRHWKAQAGDRKTIVFCANVSHCIHVAEEFRKHGVKVSMSHSKMSKAERAAEEKAFENDDTQILFNVMIMTEGFDDQRIGCVIILRTCQGELTFIQIVGRGLRLLDQERFPGWAKEDCIILDFATSHEALEQQVSDALREKKKRKRSAPREMKVCPACLAMVPMSSRECAFCGHAFPKPKGPAEAETVEMREVDLLNASRFAWVDVFGNGRMSMAGGIHAFSFALKPWGDRPDWVAFGNDEKGGLVVLGRGDRADALAYANAWLKEREKGAKSRKGSRWMTDKTTDKQNWALAAGDGPRLWSKVSPMGRYAASCRINYMKTAKAITDKVNEL